MYVPRRREWWQWVDGGGGVISGDLQLQCYVEVYTADRSVMDFRMC